MPAPSPLFGGIDEEHCSICKASYLDFRSGVTFAEAAALVRLSNGGFEAGGGYRSRGPVLWAMRVMKLRAWYEEHMGCAQMAYDWSRQDTEGDRLAL